MTALDLFTFVFDGKHFVDYDDREYYKVNNPEIFKDERLKEFVATWLKFQDMLDLIDVEYRAMSIEDIFDADDDKETYI